MRKKRKQHKVEEETLFTTRNLDIVLKTASFIGQALKATPYTKHAEAIAGVTAAARAALEMPSTEEVFELRQQNLRLQIQRITARLANTDAEEDPATHAQLNNELMTLLNRVTSSTHN